MEKIIIKYLTNQITPEELTLLNDWLKDDDNKIPFKEYVKLNQKIDFSLISSNADNDYIKVKSKLSFKKSRYTFYHYAAVILAFLALSFTLFYLTKKDNINFKNTVLELADGKLIEINKDFKAIKEGKDTLCFIKGDTLIYKNKKLKNKQNTLIVPYGKIFNLKLNDKSVVTINSGSRIKYHTNFKNVKKRTTYLLGEAYFNISSNKNKPFIVNTSKVKIKVLGTKFNVSNYNNQSNTSIVLDEGSIKVSSINKKIFSDDIILKPNEQLLVNKEISLLKNVYVKKHISWKHHKLYFVNDKFEDILKRLERYYNIPIINKSKRLNNIRYSGVFSNQPINTVLKTFQEISEFDFHITNKKIIINEK